METACEYCGGIRGFGDDEGRVHEDTVICRDNLVTQLTQAQGRIAELEGEVGRLQEERAQLDTYGVVFKQPPYDPNYNGDAVCECGHFYYRHFDTYEDMAPVGCKYCECRVFKALEQQPTTLTKEGGGG